QIVTVSPYMVPGGCLSNIDKFFLLAQIPASTSPAVSLCACPHSPAAHTLKRQAAKAQYGKRQPHPVPHDDVHHVVLADLRLCKRHILHPFLIDPCQDKPGCVGLGDDINPICRTPRPAACILGSLPFSAAHIY